MGDNSDDEPYSKKHRKGGASISAVLVVISNIFSFGLSAASSTTAALASDAAATASAYTVEPLKNLVKRATTRYFAPQIAYSDYGLSWGLSEGRKRANTISNAILRKSTRSSVGDEVRRGSAPALERPHRHSLSSVRQQGGPPRSASMPGIAVSHLGPHNTNASRRPTLQPIDTNLRPPAVSNDSSPRSPDLMQQAFFHYSLRRESLSPPTPTSARSDMTSDGSMPVTPVSPLTRFSGEAGSQHKQLAALKHGSIPISRFSFWNLVGLGESADMNTNTRHSAVKHNDARCSGAVRQAEERMLVSYDEEDATEEGGQLEQESYRRLCYL